MTKEKLEHINWVKRQIEMGNCELEFLRGKYRELDKYTAGCILIKESREAGNYVICDNELSKKICELAINYLEAQKEKHIAEFEAL